MADSTKIEWTDATWNPVTGCSVVSPGCTNCYAMRLAGTRLRNHPSRQGLTIDTKAGPVWNGQVRFNESWLTDPLRWRAPRRIFVCAHGDLFHEAVPDEWIDKVFAVMALAPQHTFQVLTKRAARMRDYIGKRTDDWVLALSYALTAAGLEKWADAPGRQMPQWPLPNVWLGVSVEDQARADERIPHLLATPAAVRFISAEPLLGPLDLTRIDLAAVEEREKEPSGLAHLDALIGTHFDAEGSVEGVLGTPDPKLDWVIAGGESGPNARPFNVTWARSLVDQCKAAGVACFVKQLGSNVVGPHSNGINETTWKLKAGKGGNWSEWPEDLRMREFPNA